jgi:hypothetical protein
MGFFENDTSLNSSKNLITPSVTYWKMVCDISNIAVFLLLDKENG